MSYTRFNTTTRGIVFLFSQIQFYSTVARASQVSYAPLEGELIEGKFHTPFPSGNEDPYNAVVMRTNGTVSN